MIKISISKGQTAITLEADGHELKAAMVDAYDLFKQMQESNPAIPFEEKLPVKEISAEKPFELTDDELDMIEKAKEKNDEKRAKAEKEMIEAVADIVKDTDDKKKRELAEKIAAAEKAEKEAIEKAKAEKAEDDAENEARILRAKARKKRSFLYQAALLDEEVTSEMIAQAESDVEEEKEDAENQAIYDEKYAKKPVKTENKPEETKIVEKHVETKKEDTTEVVKTETETAEKVETEEVDETPETKGEVLEKIKLMFSNGKNEHKQALKLMRKGIEMLKAIGVERTEAVVDIMTNVTIQKTLWDMITRRPEVMVAKIGVSKDEADQIIELMK